MYLQITRPDPANDRTPFRYHYWALGGITKKQEAQLKRFAHRTRGDVIKFTLLGWQIAVCSSIFILMVLGVSIPIAVITPLAIASVGFAISIFRRMRLWRDTAARLQDHRCVAREGDYSWLAYHRIVGRPLSTLSGEEIQVVDLYFQECIEHEPLLRQSQLEWIKRARMQAEVIVKAQRVREKLDFHQRLQEVAQETEREYAAMAAIVGRELEQERRFELHERVNQVLNQPRLS